ncbi:Rpn family recombination-promoting nuclease/putative transposase, partial [uncultured Fibrobacter sp.]|uniref:Rpn family recombination-promoting nuclease/putative transposase n=1 Tax=uncultured Fibrobacter sp. TaxID=261512 RepID=UPI0025F324D7
MENKDPKTKTDETSKPKPHDAFFRWLFGDVGRLRHLLVLSGKVNRDIGEFISEVNLDTLVRIPDSYSEVAETGEADLAFRVEVASGAPLLVGILVEHKSGRDSGTLDQIARYVNSVMKIYSEHRAFSGLPTMAIIFYNGRENWNPLGSIEDRYPSCFRGRILPFACSFVNMIDIPDSDCLACEDTATGMGIVAMKYAYDREKLLQVLPQFKKALQRMPHDEAACLLAKISIYLKEYVT